MINSVVYLIFGFWMVVLLLKFWLMLFLTSIYLILYIVFMVIESVVLFIATYVNKIVFKKSRHIIIKVTFIIWKDESHGPLYTINILILSLLIPIFVKQRIITFQLLGYFGDQVEIFFGIVARHLNVRFKRVLHFNPDNATSFHHYAYDLQIKTPTKYDRPCDYETLLKVGVIDIHWERIITF